MSTAKGQIEWELSFNPLTPQPPVRCLLGIQHLCAMFYLYFYGCSLPLETTDKMNKERVHAYIKNMDS